MSGTLMCQSYSTSHRGLESKTQSVKLFQLSLLSVGRLGQFCMSAKHPSDVRLYVVFHSRNAVAYVKFLT
jgi:hypothetical protein